MKIKVKIGPLLQENAGLPDTVEVNCDTVGQCLDELVRQYSQSKDWLYDEDSLIKVLLTINNVETITLNEEGLRRTLRPGDELQIFAVVSGG
jgi:molybdopterin converting factor small subunit